LQPFCIVNKYRRHSIERFVLVLLAGVIAVLLFLLFRFRDKGGERSPDDKRAPEKGGEVDPGYRTCPLCSSGLKRGERVHTVVFGPSPKSNPSAPEERIAHIFGCPHCYPADPQNKRICPVCRKALSGDGFLYARMFERPGKTHVHVIGCTGCRGIKKKR
jgi:hypothetical protein